MGIRVLPPDVTAKIAAGEVVERPASVVKELVENAIDAGATTVRVEIRQGGRRLVRVTDNGEGIPADEVELAFARHATGKLVSAEDLFDIHTLGFRGEALASIAAVSRVTLVTQAASESIGTLVRLEGGELLHRESKGRVPGTVVTIENLFYNTPARLKFLRSDPTEASHALALVTSYALAYPELRFTLLKDGRLVLQTMGTGELYNALVDVLGLQVAQQMLLVVPQMLQVVPQKLEVPAGTEESLDGQPATLRVWGYVSSPALNRSNRRSLLFFVNRRWVQDGSLAYAVEQAYHTLLPRGRHPIAVLNVQVDPAEVDVNIHPTKREVRFRNQRQVFSAVQRAVRRVLINERPIPGVSARPVPLTAEEWERRRQFAHVRQPGGARMVDPGMEMQRTADREPVVVGAQRKLTGLPMLRVVGQLSQMYIIAEGPDGAYLLDQHAAHERVLYEKLKAQRASQNVPSQALLEPLTVELLPQQAAVVGEHQELLLQVGFELEPFGGSTILVRRVPAALVGKDIAAAISEILDQDAKDEAGMSWEEHTLRTLVCHTSIRAGQTLPLEEMRDLVRQLEQTSLPHTCPHGRPTMIHLSAAQLEREFGRH
ncbi:MAG: DNA mismatch repair endonuclease MutL [Anaerolineae bacterium]|nr:DNA mismatch repair endonuclease MutL [Anaerolineae bacterium]